MLRDWAEIAQLLLYAVALGHPACALHVRPAAAASWPPLPVASALCAGRLASCCGGRPAAAGRGTHARATVGLRAMADGEGPHEHPTPARERGPSPTEAPVCLDRWLATWKDFVAGTVLIVGDGNLSFSLAMARAFPRMRLVCTTYDAEDFVLKKYGAEEVIRELVERGAAVHHGIDATALQQTLASKQGPNFSADCIVFNFPHHPGKGRIQRNRDLVRDFFLSARTVLAPHGQIRVSLAAGQGGTPIDKPRLWGDTWQVTEQGAIARLLLAEVYPFLAPPGYYCRGYKSQDKGFHLTGALQHVFIPQEQGAQGLYPAAWPHDISFWVPDSFEDRLFEDLARCAYAPSLQIFRALRVLLSVRGSASVLPKAEGVGGATPRHNAPAPHSHAPSCLARDRRPVSLTQPFPPPP